MINFMKKKKNRKQRRNEPVCYTIEDAIKKFGSKLRDNYPLLAECPSCGYQFSELTICRCVVLSFERQPEIRCLQCNEIYPVTNLKKIEEKTNVDLVNNPQ